MNDARTWRRANLIALGALILGAVASILGAVVDPAGFFPAWLCAFLLWLGVPARRADPGAGPRSDRWALDGGRPARA